jgi:hypothetical protein
MCCKNTTGRQPGEAGVLSWQLKREQERGSAAARRRGARNDGRRAPSPARYVSAPQARVARGVGGRDTQTYDGKAAAGRAEGKAEEVKTDVRWNRRYEELVEFRRLYGRNFETLAACDKLAYNTELYWWTQHQRLVGPPRPHAPRRKPYTLAPTPSILAPKPATLAAKPSALAPKPSTLAPKPQTSTLKPATLNPALQSEHLSAATPSCPTP